VFIQGLRWHLLCGFLGVGSSFREDLTAVWAAHFLNNVLPTSSLGDVLRSYSLRGRAASRTQWVGSLLIEKYLAISTALALAGFVVLIGQTPEVPNKIKLMVIAFLLCAVSAPAIMKVICHVCAVVLPRNMLRFLGTLASTITKSIRNGKGVMSLLTSILINAVICTIFYCVSLGMGLDIGIWDCFFLVPVFTILAGLPISYGGWGVREMTSIQLLQYYGIQDEIALSTTIFFGLIIFTSSLPGVFFLPNFRKALTIKKTTEENSMQKTDD
jgi:uncharacterized protein (TIRG00374 family)